MTLAQSRFFPDLVARYPRAPSIALCRVPELELLSAVTLQPPVLDHCCGDGWIAGQAFPGREIIGINCLSLIEQHGSLHCVTMQLPAGVLP